MFRSRQSACLDQLWRALLNASRRIRSRLRRCDTSSLNAPALPLLPVAPNLRRLSRKLNQRQPPLSPDLLRVGEIEGAHTRHDATPSQIAKDPGPRSPWIWLFRNPPEQPGRKRRGLSLATAGPPCKHSNSLEDHSASCDVLATTVRSKNAQVLCAEVMNLLEKGAIEIQPLLPRPQKRLRPATYSRSQTPELSLDEKVIQDDHLETDPPANLPRGLVHVAGSERHVLLHPGSPPSQTIHEIRSQRGGISIQGPAVRQRAPPAHGSENLGNL